MCAIYDCDVCMCRMFSATAKVSIKKLQNVRRPSHTTSQFNGKPAPEGRVASSGLEGLVLLSSRDRLSWDFRPIESPRSNDELHVSCAGTRVHP